MEGQVLQAELMLQARLRGMNLARGGFVAVGHTVPEDVARYMLLQELGQRQRHEREKREGRPQPATTTNNGKTTTETSKQCAICIETYTNTEDAFPFPPVLRSCSARHDMDVCVICLCTHIKSQLESRGSAACEDIRCPNLDCDHVYTYKQIKLLADRETFSRYDQQCLNINLAKQPNFRRCLRGRCTNGQIYDGIDPDSPFGNRIFCSECGFVMSIDDNIQSQIWTNYEGYHFTRTREEVERGAMESCEFCTDIIQNDGAYEKKSSPDRKNEPINQEGGHENDADESDEGSNRSDEKEQRGRIFVYGI
ncbi:hypothetical protein CEP52_010382 [Fusarium oligoseptatum]|uniref:RING-type domain-containing protein n=1 Tax=Fusarium oligoseptatum TaxID=2604345 RepID=A0A428T8I0_9HYPO|nr:hypothetical protein CEP52_010382 [Fusarium oligoseptatum]